MRTGAEIRSLPLVTRLIHFAVGLVIFLTMVGFFMSGYTPPGVAGEVLRHNRLHQIDASPLFYTEVENMHQLEAGVQRMRGLEQP